MLTARDGVKLRYLTYKYTGSSSNSGAGNGKVVLFCNPLGQEGFTSYAAVIAACTEVWGSGITFICWDYRSFFQSDTPKRLRNICVRNHAEDGAEVLRAVVGEQKEADVVVGHSMGVQVALEFALLYPERVGALVLLNGTYGHALQTGFQPLIKLPYMGDILSALLMWLLQDNRESQLDAFRHALDPFIGLYFKFVNRFFGSAALQKVMGDDYMEQLWKGYLGGICSNRKSMTSFFRGFQVLDAHTTAHLLYQLGHPTLLIAGIWDVFTPAYTMSVMNRFMPNSRLVTDIFSSHFTCAEHPELVMEEMANFLTKELPRYKRQSEFEFQVSSSSD